MPDVQYRAILDATDVIAKIVQIENRLLSLPQRAPILFRVNDTAAKASLTNIEQRLKRLGGAANTQRITVNLGTRGSVDPLLAQFARAELAARRLTLASGSTLGMTQRLGGAFAFMPGPLGLYASAASGLTGALNGLSASQKLNTIGAFALVGGLTAIGVSVAALASHGIAQLKDFQQALNIMTLQGPEAAARLEGQVRSIQERGGRPAQQFNRAEIGLGAAELTKQGLEEADALKVVAQALKLAGAEGEKLNDVSTLLLANLRQFGKDGAEAGDSAELFADKLTRASVAAARNSVEMQKALSVVGPFANKAGFTLDETLGILTALDNAGLKAATIGANSFRAVLMALASPTGPAREQIEKLGVSLRNFEDGSARPVRDILFDLLKATQAAGKGYDDASKEVLSHADTVEAASTIFRSRGVVGFLNLAGSAQKWIDTVKNGTITASEYADKMTEGPIKAQERLRKSVDDLALSFAQTFGPKLTEGLDLVTKSFRDLDELTQNPGAVKAYLEAITVGIGGITVALALNTSTAKVALGVNGIAGVLDLLKSTVAGGVLVKAATYLKSLSIAGSVVFKLNGFAGLLTFLKALPVAAGATLASIALLAGGVAAYGAKIGGDVQRIYGQIDSDGDKHQQELLARVADLRKKGPLGRLQAQQALTIELRYNVENSAERNAELDATLLKLRGQIKAEQDHQAALLASKKAKHTDVLATAEQNDAYDSLLTRLDDLSSRFGEVKTTSFQRNLLDARKSLEDFGKEVDKQAGKGEITPAQAAGLKKRAADAQPDLIASLTTRQLEEDRKTLVGYQRETDQVRLSLIKDGRTKRQQEYDAEVTALREKYGPEIRDALTNAQAKGLTPAQRRSLQEGAGALQAQENRALVLARKKLNDDLAQLDEDRALKTRNAATAGLAQTASEMEGNTKILQGEYAHQVELASASVAGRLVAERRLAPLLEAQRGEARQARLIADRAAARNEYDDAVRAARDQGAARSRLEEEARTAYLSKSRALEAAYQDDVEGYHLDTLHAIQEAGAAVAKKQLDLDLKSVQTWTGAQLAAYARMLEAKKATALADGDVARVKVLSDALETIAGQRFDNLASFKQDVADAAKGLEDLRSRLDNLNPNKDPRQAARSSAASPFNSLIADAGKQQRDLGEAFGKLTPEQQRAQLAAYQGQQRELDALILSANRQRNTALLTADQAFDRERQDKAQASALKLAKTEYERTRDSGPYLVALEQDRAFWAARVLITKEGSQERATAEQQLADNATARKATLDADRQLSDQRREMTRDEAEGALTLAKTDEERTLQRARLLALDRQRLAALPAEIAAARARGDTEEQVNALRREQLALQGTIRTLEGDEAAQADQRRQLVRDEVAGQLELARSDAERATLRARLRDLDQQRLDALPAEIAAARARGATEDQINTLKREQLSLGLSLQQARDGEVQRTDDLLAAQLRVQAAQTGYAEAIARSNAEVVAAKQRGILDTQGELAQIDRQLAEREQRGLTDVDVQGLIADRLGKQTSLYGQQRALREYLASLDRDALALLESQIALQQRLTGAANDPLASKAAEIAATRRALAQNARDLASPDATEADRVKLQTTRNGLLGEEVTQQRELVQLGFQIQQSEAELGQARQQAALKLAGLGDDAVATAQLDLDIARQRLTAKQGELALAEQQGQGQVTLNGLRKEEVELTGQLYDAEKKVGDAVRARQTLLDSLVVSDRELAAATARGSAETVKLRTALDGVATARERVSAAEREYRRVQGEVAAEVARNGQASSGTLERLKGATEGLTSSITAQRSAVQGVADAYGAQLAAMTRVQQAGDGLRKVLDGEKGGRFDGNREIDRFYALEQRRNAAIKAAQDALASGDKERIATTTEALAQVEDRYRKQGGLLNKNGIRVSLSNEKSVEDIANAVDKLGIQYDKEAARLEQQQRLAQQQGESVHEFGGYVGQFDAAVDRLRGVDGGAAAEASAPPFAGTERALDPVRDAKVLARFAEFEAFFAQQAAVTQAAPPAVPAVTPQVLQAALAQAVQAPATRLPPVSLPSVPGGNVTYLTQNLSFQWEGQELPKPTDLKDLAAKLYPFFKGTAMNELRRRGLPDCPE